jgi:regulator of replication initiation timing
MPQKLDPKEIPENQSPERQYSGATNGPGAYYHKESGTRLFALNEQTADAFVRQGFVFERELHDGDIVKPASPADSGASDARMSALEANIGKVLDQNERLAKENAELRNKIDGQTTADSVSEETGDDSTDSDKVVDQFKLKNETWSAVKVADGSVKTLRGDKEVTKAEYKAAKKEAEKSQEGDE